MEGSDLTIHKLRESLTETQIAQFIASLSEQEAMALMYDWRFWARPNQILPDWAWRFALALCGRGYGKCLFLKEKILTENRGWIEWGDLVVGDILYTEKGDTTRVTFVHPVRYGDKCYRLTFNDGSTIIANSDHRWSTLTRKDRLDISRKNLMGAHGRFPIEWVRFDKVSRQGPLLDEGKLLSVKKALDEGMSVNKAATTFGLRKKSINKIKNEYGSFKGYSFERVPSHRVKTTEEIASTLLRGDGGRRFNHCIPTCYPLAMEKKHLPIHPYLLGLWLGDGRSNSGAVTGYLRKCSEQIKTLRDLGVEVGDWMESSPNNPECKKGWYRVKGLTSTLRDLGLYENKHIPRDYLFSCEEDRRWLLMGLLDTDGSCRKDGVIEFCNTNKDLIDGCEWLATSLGYVPKVKLHPKGPNNIAPLYKVSFTTREPVFNVPHKLANQSSGGTIKGTLCRYIVHVEEIESVPVRCITVDNPNETYLVGKALIVSMNTRMGSEWVIERAKAGKGPISLVGQTSADVRDVMVEAGPSSIMMCSPPDFMPLYEPSKRRLTWPNGVTATTFSGDEPGQLRGPQSQCLVAGTKVIVDGKERNIETLSVGTEVLTRFGYFEVEAVRDYQSEVGSVKFSNGSSLRGTFNHPVWSLDRNDWIWMRNLREKETVTTGMSQKMVTSVAGLIEKQLSSTDGCGPILMDQFQKGLSFTIRMGTDRITVLPTWKLFQTQITQNCTLEMAIRELLTEPMSKNVFLVDENTLLRKITGQGSVKNVAPEKLKREGKRFGHVVTVGKNFCLVSETSVANVVSTWGGVGSETVYSLQVAGPREYIANDIVVHNTVWIDELPKFDDPQEAFDQVSFGLRIGDARCLITTTPTPHKIIKELYTDAINQKTLKSGAKRVHLITGSTMDNSDNLDPDALEDMVAKYEGTRLGEQELHGKILWEAENALWKQSDIDRDRTVESQVPHFRMSCIGVDPTVGDPGKTVIDECGIMTGGLGYDGHGYLTGDYTFKGTPAQWAGKIAALLNNGAFDFVVAEKNNGGLLVTETLKSYGVPEARIILVHASQGKLTRAEPISLLSEQGKIHHVGEYVQLEQELVCYEGKGRSPNRLDAFVWLFTFLLLGKENREVSVRTKRF